MIINMPPDVTFGYEKTINLWMRGKGSNIDLAVLIALQLEKNWEGKLRLIRVVEKEKDKEQARASLYNMKQTMRLPKDTEVKIMVGDFLEANLPQWFTQGLNVQFYFGGTSILIVVGVAMDTMQQIEAQLVMRHYDGFMRRGRLKGRRG